MEKPPSRPKSVPAEGSPQEPKPPAAQEPNLDEHVGEQIEQGHGESGASGASGNPRIRETDRPGDFTPELEDAMRQEYGSDSNPPEEAIDVSEISEF
ncbi:MAG: hypothetical protein VKJ64_12245 [Leptolyngbyaceae bacterium]|nr:hypothetical protein [Leptolyngbyaceae bacterium]